MKNLKVKRIDGIYFICEDKDKKMFAIEKADMPKSVKEGDMIMITSDGRIEVKVN